MSNDGLNSALQTLGGLMATNLQKKGVSNANASNGLTTLANKILNMQLQKLYTSIDIDITSLNLVYGDDFNVTGSLTDEDSNVISSATVKLLVGSTIVDTQTTDSNGDVSFTYCPVSMGTHTFKLVYEGDNTYYDCTSSTVNKTVNKETTYLSVSGSSTTTIYSDEVYNVSGSLLDNDSPTPHPVVNKQVNVYLANNLITYFTTDNNGNFSGNISVSDLNGIGEHALTFSFLGDDNYTASSIQKTVIVQSPSLSLSSNKSILSYADNDTCTLTAILSKGSGYIVKLYNADTDELVGTMTDNEDDIYSYTYQSQGVGNVKFYAKYGNFVSETCSIEDCILIKDSVTNTNFPIDVGVTGNFSMAFDIYVTDQWNWFATYLKNTENNTIYRVSNMSSSYDNSSNQPIKLTNYPPRNSWTPILFVMENGNVTMSSNGTVKGTANNIEFDYNDVYVWNSKTTTKLRNIKIKKI